MHCIALLAWSAVFFADGAAASPTATRVAVGGTPVRVLHQGPEEAQVVLLLHGATYDASLWWQLGVAQRLAAAGFHVAAADLPGHGATGRPPVGRGAYVDALIAALHRPRTPPPVLVGHSYGGAYALAFAADPARQADSRVAALVLAAPAHTRRHLRALGRFFAPVLVVWGRDDDMVSPARARPLAAAFGDSRVVWLPGGHEPYRDDADAFVDAIVAFASRAPRGWDKKASR